MEGTGVGLNFEMRCTTSSNSAGRIKQTDLEKDVLEPEGDGKTSTSCLRLG